MHDFDELTPGERDELAGLPRHREPGRMLEERTVRELRARGLLQTPRNRGWWSAAAAAAIALFATGFALGQRSATLAVAERFDRTLPVDAMQAARQVQRTGSAYIEAIAALSDASMGSDADAIRQGREAARAALYAAAVEFASLSPRDPVASQLLWLLSERPDGVTRETAAQTVLWF